MMTVLCTVLLPPNTIVDTEEMPDGVNLTWGFVGDAEERRRWAQSLVDDGAAILLED